MNLKILTAEPNVAILDSRVIYLVMYNDIFHSGSHKERILIYIARGQVPHR